LHHSMRAMVLAAGLGTRLRPLTYEISKPMVPVLDRPVMEHILDLLERHSFTEVIANLHHFPDEIRDYFGDGSELGVFHALSQPQRETNLSVRLAEYAPFGLDVGFVFVT